MLPAVSDAAWSWDFDGGGGGGGGGGRGGKPIQSWYTIINNFQEGEMGNDLILLRRSWRF